MASRFNTDHGPGRDDSGFHPDHTTSCQMTSVRRTAPSLGHRLDQMRAAERRVGRGRCTATSGD
jgi:hypothetical protein